MIKGEDVILYETTITGVDEFGVEEYSETETIVHNVLVGSPLFEEAVNELNLTGRRLAFTLGIPKGDTHNWKEKKVMIRGELFRTYGYPLTQLEANVPTPWNTQVKVERYE